MSDSELLDILETEMKSDPLLLWFGDGEFPTRKPRGLSLLGGDRSLRQAISVMARGRSYGDECDLK